MSAFLAAYALFLLKLLTVLGGIALAVVAAVLFGAQRREHAPAGKLQVRKLNDTLEHMEQALDDATLDPGVQKERHKSRLKAEKAESKSARQAEKRARRARGKGETRIQESPRRRIFVLDFDGDVRASDVDRLRREVDAVLTAASGDDEVLLRMESGGGVVHGYGLGASQLQRIRDARIPLTVSVDKVAASGGYMMAAVGSHVMAAPFAIIGSIGVVAQFPNLHKLLQKHDIDVETITAGKYKRTLTVFGENTDEGRAKFVEDIERIHQHFKDHIQKLRPGLNIDAVATGEVWLGSEALALKLVDSVGTSDAWLCKVARNADVLELQWHEKKSLSERLPFAMQAAVDRFVWGWFERIWRSRLPS